MVNFGKPMKLTAIGIQGKPYVDGTIQAYVEKYLPIILDKYGVWKAMIDGKWKDYFEAESDKYDTVPGDSNLM